MQRFEQISLLPEHKLKLIQQRERLLQQLGNNKIQFTQKQINSSYHICSQKQGFEIQLIQSQIQTFFAYFRFKKFSQFSGHLPFNLSSKSTLRSVILFLGQPQIKSKHIVQTIYENLGLGVVFQGTWNNDQSFIQYCYIFKANDEKYCASCKNKIIKSKQNKLMHKCDNCNYVDYCSSQCKNKHIGLHNIICQSIDQ